MRVKTNGRALGAAAVLAAVLTFVTVGDGSAPKPVRERATETSATAGGHFTLPRRDSRVSTAPQEAAEIPRDPPPPPFAPEPQAEILQVVSSPDALVLRGFQGALAYLAVFVTGHLVLRRLRFGSRWSYSGLGSASALLCVASQTPLQGWRNLLAMGNLSYYLAIPLLAGLIMGFVYQWRAGFEPDGDDPALLAATLEAEEKGDRAVGALVDTGQAEYFEGPLQVRTTFPVAFVAALLSSGVFGLVAMAAGVPSEVRGWMESGQNLAMSEMIALGIQAQLHVIFLMGFMAPVPFAALVMLGQVILRAFDKTSYRAYLLTGAASPLLLLLLLGPLGVLLGMQAALPMAVAMCVYRNMAGLEPKRIKEDILVRDRRDLVGADHARRRFGRVIKA